MGSTEGSVAVHGFFVSMQLNVTTRLMPDKRLGPLGRAGSHIKADSRLMGRSQNTPGKTAVAKLADDDGLSNLIELASMEDECMRPFTYPITENDWALAFGLVENTASSPMFGPFQGAAGRARRRQARSWEYGEFRDRPFILWLCEVMC